MGDPVGAVGGPAQAAPIVQPQAAEQAGLSTAQKLGVIAVGALGGAAALGAPSLGIGVVPGAIAGALVAWGAVTAADNVAKAAAQAAQQAQQQAEQSTRIPGD